MTRRERFKQTMLFGNTDRTYYIYRDGLFRGAVLNRWLKEGLQDMLSRKYDESEVEDYGGPRELLDEIVNIFGLDRDINLPVDFSLLPGFEQKILEETDQYKIWIDYTGVKRKDFKKQLEPGFVTRSWIDFPVIDEKDFRGLEWRYDPLASGRYPDNWEALKKEWESSDYVLKLVIPGLFWQVRDWVGFENTCMMFYDNPRLMYEMMEFWTDFLIRCSTRVLDEVKVDYVLINEDMAYKTASMISPKMVREFMVPNYKKIINHLKSKGVEIILLDSDGNVDELIPIWIDLGINATYPLEVAAGMDPVKVRKKYGKNIAMIGGIDKRELSHDFKHIDEEVDKKVPYLLETDGYIPAVDHAVPADISLQNYMHFLERIRKYE